MNVRNVVGVIVVMTAVACGPEATRTPAPTGTAVAQAPSPAPEKAPPATPEKAPETATPAPATPPPVAGAGAADPGPTADATPPGGEPAVAKSGAPVTLKATFNGSGAADLDVVFGADGKDVLIKVWGVDGLKVTKHSVAAPLPSVRKGQALKVAVEYTAPSDRDSNLAVSVTGQFAGHEQSRVQSFTVKASAPAPKATDAAPTVDKDGRKIKVMAPK